MQALYSSFLPFKRYGHQGKYRGCGSENACLLHQLRHGFTDRPATVAYLERQKTRHRKQDEQDIRYRDRLKSSMFVAVCIVRFMPTTRKTMKFPKMKKKFACMFSTETA